MRRLPMLAIPLAFALALALQEWGSDPVAAGERLGEPAPSASLGDEGRAFAERDPAGDRCSTKTAPEIKPALADSAERAAGEKNEFIQVLRVTLRVTRILINVALELVDRGLELIA